MTSLLMCRNVVSLGYDCHLSTFSLRLVTHSSSAVHSQPTATASRSGSHPCFFSSWTVCGRYSVSSLVLLNLMRISSSCSLSMLTPHSLEPSWATMKVKGGYTAHVGAIFSCFGYFLKETRICFYVNVINI